MSSPKIAPPFSSMRLPKGVATDRVLLYLKAYHLAHDRFPTKMQIAQHFGFCSHNASYYHLSKLMKRGEIVKDGRNYFKFARP